MKFYVINLDRSPARLESIRKNFDRFGLDFCRVPAVDGAALPDHEIDAVYDASRNRWRFFTSMKRGEIACFLSHRSAWQRLLESSDDYAIVMEDDLEWRVNPASILNDLEPVMKHPEGRIVKLFCKRSVGEEPVAERPLGVLEQPVVVPLGMVAYAVNRAGAEQLLSSTARFWEPVDVAVQRWWDTKVRVFTCRPSLVREISAALGGSTLHRTQKEPALGKIMRELRRPLFRFQRTIESHARFAWRRMRQSQSGSNDVNQVV